MSKSLNKNIVKKETIERSKKTILQEVSEEDDITSSDEEEIKEVVIVKKAKPVNKLVERIHTGKIQVEITPKQPILPDEIVNVVEYTKTGRVRKPRSEKQILALRAAQIRKSELDAINRTKKMADDKTLNKLYQKEIEHKIENGSIPKRVENKLRKDILVKLKEKKLAELKEKYNYNSDDTSDEDKSESDTDYDTEEEVEKVVEKKKKVVKKVVAREHPVPKNPTNVLDVCRSYGF
jgi:hypothetical protein